MPQIIEKSCDPGITQEINVRIVADQVQHGAILEVNVHEDGFDQLLVSVHFADDAGSKGEQLLAHRVASVCENCDLAADLCELHAREADSEDGIVGEHDSIELVVLTAYLLELIDEVHYVRLRPE